MEVHAAWGQQLSTMQYHSSRRVRPPPHLKGSDADRTTAIKAYLEEEVDRAVKQFGSSVGDVLSSSVTDVDSFLADPTSTASDAYYPVAAELSIYAIYAFSTLRDPCSKTMVSILRPRRFQLESVNLARSAPRMGHCNRVPLRYMLLHSHRYAHSLVPALGSCLGNPGSCS